MDKEVEFNVAYIRNVLCRLVHLSSTKRICEIYVLSRQEASMCVASEIDLVYIFRNVIHMYVSMQYIVHVKQT